MAALAEKHKKKLKEEERKIKRKRDRRRDKTRVKIRLAGESSPCTFDARWMLDKLSIEGSSLRKLKKFYASFSTKVQQHEQNTFLRTSNTYFLM